MSKMFKLSLGGQVLSLLFSMLQTFLNLLNKEVNPSKGWKRGA
jgi:hypothetical protein